MMIHQSKSYLKSHSPGKILIITLYFLIVWNGGEQMKYSKKFTLILLLLITSIFLLSCKEDSAPTFNGVHDVSFPIYDSFDPLAGVTATDPEDGDLTDRILITSNNVETTTIGSYTVAYSVTDSSGQTITATRLVTMTALDSSEYPLAQYESGIDLSKLQAEDKAVFYAAAERYLLDNVYGGVPLYTRATRVMYASRVQLFSPEYNSVLGFGDSFSQLTEDDSQVLMDIDTYGNANEYTWRSSYNADPVTLNPWEVEDSTTTQFTDMYSGGLYDFYFDDTKTGYDILPSLAKSEPIPATTTIIDGEIYSKIWRIELRDDLQWKFHPNTDVSGLPSGYEDLDATDYLWTWRQALEQAWFRSRTGGGDFISQGIKNAFEFINGTATWNQVGLRLAAGTTNTIELEYEDEKSAFEVMYAFTGSVLAPINQELFEDLGDDYGQDPTSIACSGTYYLDSWTYGDLLTYKKNDLHPDQDMYQYTGYQYRFINGIDEIFAEFEAGRLENSTIPNARVLEFVSDPRTVAIPSSSIVRLNFNMFGTEENRDAYIETHPDSNLDETWIPEPILSYLPFRQALYYGIDRYYAAVELAKTYLPAHTILTSAFFIDGQEGLSIRGSAVGEAIVDDFGGDSNAYFPDSALALFKVAVEEAIADGYYTQGSIENYTIITLELYYTSSGNATVQTLTENLKQQYESLLIDDTNFVRIMIQLHDIPFPNIYNDYISIAKMDLGIGSLSTSYLCDCNYMLMYSDENPYDLLMNWGIDTSSANIPIAYHNLEGKMVYEMWSYNAIVHALDEETQIKDGVVYTS